MTTIRILPEILANKIAAGEVVERPASVVKELVENALDAEGHRIHVELEHGGRSLIRVSDNGLGMNRDDALLSIERYATSKIQEDSDLFAIRTLGFRGEALPSIAAVSRLSLITRSDAAESGCEIKVEGGRIQRVSDIGAPVGTMITVKQLFFNTPARRKFLKTTPTEMGHIADTVASFALSRPDVHFQLTHNQKTVKNWVPAIRQADRIEAVLGLDISRDFYSLEYNCKEVALTGWIAAPRQTRSTSRSIYLFVNGRRVRDRIVQHALCEGYRQRLMKGQFPLAALFLQVPFDQVDVNVHPTKHEVRFARQKQIHEAVRAAVSQTLTQADRPQWAPVKPTASQRIVPPAVAESRFQFKQIQPATIVPSKTVSESPVKQPDAGQAEIWAKRPFADLKPIGQYHGSYLLCESDDELIIIDQHAAHERIVFEQLKKQSQSARKMSQRLLMPETLELGFKEAEILERLIPELEATGLEIEPFGGSTYLIQAVPAAIARKEIVPLVIALVEQVLETGFASTIEKTLEQCLVVLACHGTIRANRPMSKEEVKQLLLQLDECENPSHCPHGRPTYVTWTKRSIEKLFQRIPG